MKILSVAFKRKVNCSVNVCLWNHFDHDHINYVHSGSYKSSEIFYEDDRSILCIHKMAMPLVPFLKINTIDVTILKDRNTILTYGFQYGIPSLSETKYKEISKDKCVVEVNYKFQFNGLDILFYPLIKFLLPKWDKRTWDEDLPIKLRKQKIQKLNFKEYKGLPKKIKDRKSVGQINFKIPFKRLQKDDNILTNHPFYNFGRKDDQL